MPKTPKKAPIQDHPESSGASSGIRKNPTRAARPAPAQQKQPMEKDEEPRKIQAKQEAKGRRSKETPEQREHRLEVRRLYEKRRQLAQRMIENDPSILDVIRAQELRYEKQRAALEEFKKEQEEEEDDD